MDISLGEIAARFGAEVHGDADCRVRRVAALDQAGEGDVAFLSAGRFRRHLADTRASAVILAPDMRDACPVNALVTRNPQLLFARVAALLHPAPAPTPGIHPTAVIGEGCDIGAGVGVGAHAVIGDGARLGERVSIGAGSVVGAGVEIGADSALAANVTLYPSVRIGCRVVVHSGAVIGADGFGFANDRGAWVRIPQLGGVVIGDDVEVGANTTIDRGALGDTVIAEGVKLDNLVQIAHNVRVGAHTAIAGCVGIAGSTTIGKRCAIGGGAGISGHLRIADDVHLTGTTFVTQSISEKGVYSSGAPFEPASSWRRNYLRMRQLDDMAHRLARLEAALGGARDKDDKAKG